MHQTPTGTETTVSGDDDDQIISDNVHKIGNKTKPCGVLVEDFIGILVIHVAQLCREQTILVRSLLLLTAERLRHSAW